MVGSPKLTSPIRALGGLLLATTILACGAGSPGATGGAGVPSPAGPVASPDPGTAASGLCGVFTPGELAPVLGGEPAPGMAGGPLESLCQWDLGDADLMIQKVPMDYFEDPGGGDGYQVLEAIGDHAYVAPHAFGRIAAARTADAGYLVIASEGTDEAALVDLLRRFVERSPGAPVLAAPEPLPSSDPSASAGPGAPAGCPVTTAEVSEVAGIEMVQGAGCTWSAADPGTLYEVLLTDVPLSLFEYLRTQDSIPGVGDEAYSDGGGLYVRVGDRALTIGLATLSLDEQEQREAAIAIARHAAARLG